MAKPRYWNKRSPDQQWDYIVIGSGMGGMTTAALLSKLGKKVLVLEQHYVPGGFTHTFSRKGYTWDVGVHAIGEVTQRSMPGRLLSRLTNGELEWASLGPVYDEFHWPDGVRIDFPDRPEQLRANLIAAFPGEIEAIDGYLALVRKVASAMKRYYLARATPQLWSPVTDRLLAREAQGYLELSTEEVVAELTDNEQLRSVFVSQWAYYGSTPSESSFAIQALVVKHFWHGAYYPVGGSARIAETLLKTVAKAGGWTRTQADVRQILVQGDRAVGVQLRDGEVLLAGRIVSAAGVMSTIRRLLPPRIREEAWASGIDKLSAASAHLCLYLGFKGDIREDGATAANKWFYESWDCNQDAWDFTVPGSRTGCLYCSFPSLKDPQHEPGEEQRHTGEVVTFVRWSAFAQWKDETWRKRGGDYDAMKKDIEERLLEHFFEHMPGLRDKLDYVELSTPVSTEHFCRPIEGSIYGIEPTPERFKNPWLRPRSPVKGLFFSGSEVASVGVIGAMMGGVLAAASAEPLGVARYLKNS